MLYTQPRIDSVRCSTQSRLLATHHFTIQCFSRQCPAPDKASLISAGAFQPRGHPAWARQACRGRGARLRSSSSSRMAVCSSALVSAGPAAPSAVAAASHPALPGGRVQGHALKSATWHSADVSAGPAAPSAAAAASHPALPGVRVQGLCAEDAPRCRALGFRGCAPRTRRLACSHHDRSPSWVLPAPFHRPDGFTCAHARGGSRAGLTHRRG